MDNPEEHKMTENLHEDQPTAARWDEFKKGLLALSRQTGIGLNGTLNAYLMEPGPSGDYDREYRETPDGTLAFI